ncbi:hypothetical protein Hamer_G029277 [Homarus americanus]|uniref:Uncharacterized protein n=1 Tax=Homarus americanus TaxID=6706 RepID=A0A8J5JGH2_HOMAM|nr:hypothetical protein Hamer_G029277 [Homarus americanus]
MTSIIHAHIMNIARPGTFAKAARDMFAANNLPDMEFPNDVPSSEIFNFIYKSESTEIQIPTTHEPSTQEQTTSDIQPEPASEEESMEDSSEDETTTITEQAARVNTPKKNQTGTKAPPATENKDLGHETGIIVLRLNRDHWQK